MAPANGCFFVVGAVKLSDIKQEILAETKNNDIKFATSSLNITVYPIIIMTTKPN